MAEEEKERARASSTDHPLDAFEHGPVESFPGAALVRVKRGWLPPCDGPEPEDDYAALGYEETELGTTGVFTLDVWVDRLLWSLLDAGLDWCRATDKENQDDIENG
jgi:hypothetical protein